MKMEVKPTPALRKLTCLTQNALSATVDESAYNGLLPFDEHPKEFFCDVDRVHEMLLGLDTSKSNGPDGVSARMLKQTAASIAPSISQVFTLHQTGQSTKCLETVLCCTHS